VTTPSGIQRCRRCATCSHEATDEVHREAQRLADNDMVAGAAILVDNGYLRTSDGRWQLPVWGPDERLSSFNALSVVLLNRQWESAGGGSYN
jgi:hypothetical protein